MPSSCLLGLLLLVSMSLVVLPSHAAGEPGRAFASDLSWLFGAEDAPDPAGLPSYEELERVRAVNSVNALIGAFDRAQDYKIKGIMRAALEMAKPRMGDVGVMLEYDLARDRYAVRQFDTEGRNLEYVWTERYGMVILREGQDLEAYVEERSGCDAGTYRYDEMTGDCILLWGSLPVAFLLAAAIAAAAILAMLVMAAYMLVMRRRRA